MAYSIDTKPNLTGSRFEQCVGDLLILSGCTDVHGKFEISSGGTMSVLPNRGTNKMLLSDSLGNVTLQQYIPQSNVTNLISDLSGKTSNAKFNLYTGTTAPLTYVPYTVITQSKYFTGFVDPENITVTYNWSGRTITLSGNLDYMWRGVAHALTSPWTSSGHSTTVGNWFLGSNNGTSFTWSVSPWAFDTIPVASVAYKASSTASFAKRETHGLEDWRVHEEMHYTIGTWVHNGGRATAGSYTEGLATDVAVSPSFDVAQIDDEDLPTAIPLLNKANGYTLMNIGTGSTSVYTLGATRPFLAAGANQYIYVNNVTTGAMTAGVNTRWYNVYQILIPVTSDVNSQKYRMVFLQPQVAFTSLVAAQAEDTRGLSFGTLSSDAAEYVILTRISYAASSANANYGRVTIPTGGVTYVVGTKMSQITVNGISSSNHANLSSLNWIDSGHIGTNSSIAAFDSVGVAVTIPQSTFVCSANNGLNKIGTNVRLGGALTGNTSISGAHTLNINVGCLDLTGSTTLNLKSSCGVITDSGTNGGIRYAGDYSGNYVNRSLVDKAYVTGLTTTSGVQTANNGLNKIGTNVRLGGALTGNTTITGAYTLSLTGGTQLNTTLGYQISGNTILRTSPNDISNVFIGCGAGNNTSAGGGNFGVGYHTLYNNAGGVDNIAIGVYALNCNTVGSNNIAKGNQALFANISGNNNIANGYSALYSNTGGTDNIANGFTSLYFNTIGCNNTAFGNSALYNNTSGCNNTAFGICALYNNTTGCNNTASGFYALYYNTTGCSNNASGYQALYCNTTGCNNTASGYQALKYNTTGSNNTASGYQALISNTTGSNNTASGYQALRANTTGCHNTASGYGALYNNTEGCNNNASGYQALCTNTTGCNNIASGCYALFNNSCGNNNIANGAYSLYGNTKGNHNIANGECALYTNTLGDNNFASGFEVLNNNISGNRNVGIGECALRTNAIGNDNIAFGACALTFNVCGNNNIANGNGALYNNITGSGNIASGLQALNTNLTGSCNIAIGECALLWNDFGNNNIANGFESLMNNTNGNDNITIGYKAGHENITGSTNIFLGTCAGYNETNSNRLYIASGATRPLIYGEFDNRKLIVDGITCIDTSYSPTSGSTVFNVQGTSGQLLSIVDSLCGDIFKVSDISGIPMLTVNSSGNTKVHSSLTVCKGVYTYGENLIVNIGTCVVSQLPAASYTGVFFDYVIKNTVISGLRSGTVTTVNDGAAAVFNEVSSGDIGDTTGIALCADISGGNVRLVAVATTNDWSVKTMVRGI